MSELVKLDQENRKVKIKQNGSKRVVTRMLEDWMTGVRKATRHKATQNLTQCGKSGKSQESGRKHGIQGKLGITTDWWV